MKLSSDFSCPYCGSTDTRSHRAIWEAGSISSTGHGKVSTGKLLSGGFDVQLHSVSEEAEVAEPPGKTFNHRMVAGISLAIVAPPMVYLNSLIPTYGQELQQELLPKTIFVLIALGVVLFIWGWSDAKRKDSDLDERLRLWESSWRCDRCAESFTPTD